MKSPDEIAIARRQRIAELLINKGIQDIPTQMAGGYVVPITPLTGLEKIAQQLSGAYIAKQADQQQQEHINARNKALSSIDVSSPDAANKLFSLGLPDEALKLKMSGVHAAKEPSQFYIPPNYEFKQATPEYPVAGWHGPNKDFVPYSRAATEFQAWQMDPQKRAEITAAIEGQKGIKIDINGHPIATTQYDANPEQFKNYLDADKILSGFRNTESSNNPNAKNPDSTATGLYQMTEPFRKDAGLENATPDQETAVMRQLHQARLDRYGGNEDLAILSHNVGVNAADKIANGNQQLTPQNIKYIQSVRNGGPILGQSKAEEEASLLAVKAKEEQQKANIENQKTLDLELNKKKQANEQTDRVLNDMMRYLYPLDKTGRPQVERDQTGRLIPPKEQVIAGGSPIDRARVLLHEYSNTADPKATNIKAIRRFGNQLVLQATGGSLGNSVSNSDVLFLNNAQGILNESQNINDIYNAVADIEQKIKEIRNPNYGKITSGNFTTEQVTSGQTGLTPQEQEELNQLRSRFGKQ